ncbi:MAG: acetyl-CoA carboxylase carboxyltransferase subunit alpha [Alphaproteobacteria bacterium]|nr:acetyl-CoA carboxylase carboxyltransferase subunit alpha [Alphaproteobacteria bacterium]
MRTYLDFERPVAELESKVADLRDLSRHDASFSICDEIKCLEVKIEHALKELYSKLTPWQKTQVSRHPGRPRFTHYVSCLVDNFIPLCGDRRFSDDAAIQGGVGCFRGRPVFIIGHERGGDTDGRLKHNFGMAKPEGYRKAARLMSLSDQFDLPVLSLIDTAGAYPGVGAEERGQSEAIARSTETCLSLGVPNIAVIIGQGGSGGAVAIATANKVLMLEHSIYTVASPEASASILWHDSARAMDAANQMKITSADLLHFGVIDAVIPEPMGGAHRDVDAIVKATGDSLFEALCSFDDMKRDEIRIHRQEKFMKIGTDF